MTLESRDVSVTKTKTQKEESVSERPVIFLMPPFEMDYDASIRQTVRRIRRIYHLRRNGFIDGRIAKVRILPRRADRVTVYPGVIRFTDSLWSSEVLSLMDSLGLRPSTLLEFLTIGIELPELWQRFSLVGLGTRIKEKTASTNHELCVLLEGSPSHHTLSLQPHQRIWEPESCFLFIGESKPTFNAVDELMPPPVDDITAYLENPQEELGRRKRKIK